MNFVNDAHRVCYEKTSDYMTQLFGESAWSDPDNPRFVLTFGSAETHVNVAALNETPAVAVYSWVVTGVEPSLELFKYLLNANCNFFFGAFGVDEHNDVLFQYVLPG